MKKRIFSVIMTAAIVLLLTPTWATAYHTGRAGEYPAISVGDNISFQDVSASADYADAVAWAVEKGITGGTSATAFSPDVICTRGQIVTFLYRGK